MKEESEKSEVGKGEMEETRGNVGGKIGRRRRKWLSKKLRKETYREKMNDGKKKREGIE